MRQGYPANHTYLIFAMATDTVAIYERVAVFPIMGNIFIFLAGELTLRSAGEALAVIFVAVNPDGSYSFGLLAFFSERNTWSGLHGYVEAIVSASGLHSIIFHFHCLGADALRQNPRSQVTLNPDPLGVPGHLVGEDHRQRRVLLVLYSRRETFASEADLQQHMTNLRIRLVGESMAWEGLV